MIRFNSSEVNELGSILRYDILMNKSKMLSESSRMRMKFLETSNYTLLENYFKTYLTEMEGSFDFVETTWKTITGGIGSMYEGVISGIEKIGGALKHDVKELADDAKYKYDQIGRSTEKFAVDHHYTNSFWTMLSNKLASFWLTLKSIIASGLHHLHVPADVIDGILPYVSGAVIIVAPLVIYGIYRLIVAAFKKLASIGEGGNKSAMKATAISTASASIAMQKKALSKVKNSKVKSKMSSSIKRKEKKLARAKAKYKA